MVKIIPPTSPFRVDPTLALSPEIERGDIVAYIERQLGPYLTRVYGSAIRESVSTGCYDLEWATQAPPYLRIEHYVAGLREHWFAQHGTTLLSRLLGLLDNGSKQEQAFVQRLLSLPGGEV